MRYLSGVPYAPALAWEHGGLMLTPVMGNTPNLDGVTWAADNGCFTQGEHFSLVGFFGFLQRWRAYAGSCCFAVAPDVPFDMDATWKRSANWLPHIRSLGYPAALAIQNGVRLDTLQWDAFDAVFIAGDTAFKTSQIARGICHEAKARGKHVHIARRNSGKAIQAAYDMGADTVDGTFLRFAPDHNWARMQKWFDKLCAHAAAEPWGSDPRFAYCRKCGSTLWHAA